MKGKVFSAADVPTLPMNAKTLRSSASFLTFSRAVRFVSVVKRHERQPAPCHAAGVVDLSQADLNSSLQLSAQVTRAPGKRSTHSEQNLIFGHPGCRSEPGGRLCSIVGRAGRQAGSREGAHPPADKRRGNQHRQENNRAAYEDLAQLYSAQNGRCQART